MQKIILDTNVVVSALISNSIPSKILYDLVFARLVELCLSLDIYEEYVNVMNRKKFDTYPEFKIKAGVVLSKMKDLSKIYQNNLKINILTDESDNKFLELATASSADFLITGNTLDFTIKEFEYTKILTPREYWDNFKP
jgi:uncharacterized protein